MAFRAGIQIPADILERRYLRCHKGGEPQNLRGTNWLAEAAAERERDQWDSSQDRYMTLLDMQLVNIS